MPKLTTTPRAQPADGPPSAGMELVRHSELADFRQCPLKWWVKWYLSYQQIKASAPSDLGTAWHHIMAVHYGWIYKLQQDGLLPPVEDLRGVVSVAIEHYKQTPHYDQLAWMYDGYLERYGNDPGWEIVEFESTQRVEMMPGIWYEWTTDVLVRDSALRKLRVVDHKSTRHALRQGEVDLSDQIGLYIKAQTLRGQAVADGLINQVRTEKLKRPMTLDERCARMSSYRSPVELDNIWNDAKKTVRAILAVRESGEIPYSAPDPRVCNWKCDFKETHLILRKTPEARWKDRLPALLRMRGFRQGQVPRGSDAPRIGS